MLGCCLGGGRQGWRSLPHVSWGREGNLLRKSFLQEGHARASVSPVLSLGLVHTGQGSSCRVGRAACFPAARKTGKPGLWVWSEDCGKDVNPAPSCPPPGSLQSPRAVPSPHPSAPHHRRSRRTASEASWRRSCSSSATTSSASPSWTR